MIKLPKKSVVCTSSFRNHKFTSPHQMFERAFQCQIYALVFFSRSILFLHEGRSWCWRDSKFKALCFHWPWVPKPWPQLPKPNYGRPAESHLGHECLQILWLLTSLWVHASPTGLTGTPTRRGPTLLPINPEVPETLSWVWFPSQVHRSI